ncbi:MAG TPA: iron ABC transporter permease [Oxalicibacterium sp.]|jgi:iron complex transport system permease protein|nr:iron ABC transporter permease [Oxalicibacterium sp.]
MTTKRKITPTRRPHQRAVLLGLLLLSLFSILIACAAGSVNLTFSDFVSAIQHRVDANHNMAATVIDLRLHRALSAFVTGATLSLAGVMMQALLRNPLADPYVLGVSGGAAVGALAAILLFSAAWTVDAAAFAGAIAISLLLYMLARHDLRGVEHAEGGAPLLLLSGVVLASGSGALISLLLSIAPEAAVRGMVFWLIGDLSDTGFRWLPWGVLVVALVFSLRFARAINALALHAEAALTLGVDVGWLRRALFGCSALLTASAVSNAGSIGFVGLIVPHACRFALGADHRLLLPAATLAGGIFLVLADTLARTALAPQQLPVGVMTALIGVPVFLIQLHRLRGR